MTLAFPTTSFFRSDSSASCGQISEPSWMKNCFLRPEKGQDLEEIVTTSREIAFEVELKSENKKTEAVAFLY